MNDVSTLEDFHPIAWPVIKVAAEHMVSLHIASIAVKRIASGLPQGEGRSLLAATDSALAEWDDDLCPPWFKWPFPGPRPYWAAMLAAGKLADLADTLPEDSPRRRDLASSAGQLAQQAANAILATGKG